MHHITNQPQRLCLALICGAVCLGLLLPSSAAARKTTVKTPKKQVALTAPRLQPSFSLLDSVRLDSALFIPPATAPHPSASHAQEKSPILPFLGVDRIGVPPSEPERPAISVMDPLATPPAQIMAGLTYRHGDRFFLNFGYTLPTAPLRDYAEPFGFTLTDDEDEGKRFTIGIDIPF